MTSKLHGGVQSRRRLREVPLDQEPVRGSRPDRASLFFKRSATAVLAGLTTLVVVSQIVFLAETWIPYPFADHLNFILAYSKVHTLDQFMRFLALPHNEHFMPLPKLIMAIDFSLFSGSMTVLLAVRCHFLDCYYNCIHPRLPSQRNYLSGRIYRVGDRAACIFMGPRGLFLGICLSSDSRIASFTSCTPFWCSLAVGASHAQLYL